MIDWLFALTDVMDIDENPGLIIPGKRGVPAPDSLHLHASVWPRWEEQKLLNRNCQAKSIEQGHGFAFHHLQ
ncbi:hypothetical protein SRHO_G00159560 [Serrasalmus rhombeus]